MTLNFAILLVNHQANFLSKSLEIVYWYSKKLNDPNNETAHFVKVSYIITHCGPVTLKYHAFQLTCLLRVVWYITSEKSNLANVVSEFDWKYTTKNLVPAVKHIWLKTRSKLTTTTLITASFPCFLWLHIFLFNITQVGVCGIAALMFSISFQIRYFIKIC